MIASERIEVEAGDAIGISTPVNEDGTQTSGCRLTMKNAGTESAFLGGADVTASTGFELKEGERLAIPMQPRDALYVITAENSTTLHVLRA
ncbi:hypothetical protein LCGC14_2442740 [marine sediment metagenome]|uniref:Uncharacterized protein n=1 Tax=marine sediment metagenome TaxID=412755 RepID=A0A0F9ECJ0_9ZZZZ